MLRKKYALYLWEGVLSDHTDGVMFAIAESPEHARELLRTRNTYESTTFELDLQGEPCELLLNAPFAFHLYGGG